MELVKDGSRAHPEVWEPEIECKKFDEYDREGCGAVYKIDPTDLVLRYFRGTHFRHYYTAIRCLQCGKYTRVYDVPTHVLKITHTPENKEQATFDGFSDE